MRKIVIFVLLSAALLCVFSTVFGQDSLLKTCFGKTRSEIQSLYPNFYCPRSKNTCSLFDGYFTFAPSATYFVSLEFTKGSYSYVEEVYIFIPNMILYKADWPDTAERASAIAEIILKDSNYYTLSFGDPSEIYMIYPETNIGCQVIDDDWRGYDVFCVKPYTLFDKLMNY